MEPQHELVGLPCGAEGPHLTATLQPPGFMKGKPPAMRAVVDLHVANPLFSEIWLLYNATGDYPGIVTQIELRRASLRGAWIWTFSGSGFVQAVQLAPGADVMLRDVELMFTSESRVPAVYFADRVSIAGQSAAYWFGQQSLAVSRGEYSLRSPSLAQESKLDAAEKMPIEIEVQCMHPLAGEIDVQTNPSTACVL